MLDQAIAINQTNTKPDAGYASWTSSVGRVVMRHSPDDRTAGPIPTFGQMMRDTALSAQNAHAYAPQTEETGATKTPDIDYEETPDSQNYTFNDLLDMINPLQHLPVIGTIYRKYTGDTIKPMSNIIGGAIFGGPIGAVASTVNVVTKSTTGKDVAENAFAFMGFDVAPEAKPRLTYDHASGFAPVHSLADANIQISAAASEVYRIAADGRKSFAAKHADQSASWNV